jgi:hypothetical protein
VHICTTMSLYIIFLIVFLIPVVLGVVYFRKQMSGRRQRERVNGEEAKNGTPVTLDRNPEMPKMPGATS